MQELQKGTKINDRYTLIEYKGSGSFGEVWLAHDEFLDTDIAIKIYISLDPRGIDEFKSEFKTTMGLSHQNLLTTQHFDIWQNRPFLVMKYCSNGSIAAEAGKIAETKLWHFIHDVASGLAYLHEQSEPIIHQDIKPDNVLEDSNGNFLITDFGISKKVRSTMRRMSTRSATAGAVAYMAPERFQSDPTPVKASDIWSLGASVYELATGELPFSGMGGGMQNSGAQLPELTYSWSRELNFIIRECLAKEPWDRPTARQVTEYAKQKLDGNVPTPSWKATESKIEPKPDVQPNYGYNNKFGSTVADGDSSTPMIKKGENNYTGCYVIVIFTLTIFTGLMFFANNSSKSKTNNENRQESVSVSQQPTINVSNIEICSVDTHWNIKSKGTIFDSQETEYIGVQFDGIFKQNGLYYLSYAIYDQNNNMLSGENSHMNYTSEQNYSSTKQGEKEKVCLYGWGARGYWKSGSYTIKVFCNNELMFSKSFKIADFDLEVTEESDADKLSRAERTQNWSLMKQLADEGYTAACAPLADHYLRVNNYDMANHYAVRGNVTNVINQLRNLGYYD